ncbi:NADPH-dependent oxidoreductase [Senegalia massiliensis]|uniref:NADPH-dependent oxidoreductase n=1 Tax=Senegalia massiliensis TaxID=1720316 RepID=UPI001A90D061|nr:NADPH-dependent oxidoreductase [Senegalia massiliensis]
MLNNVLDLLKDHRSIRKYKEDSIPEEYLDNIIQAVQSAPTSINGQQISVIAVEDKAKKKKISELSGDQEWIDQAPLMLIFCSDFYKAKLALEKQGKDFGLIDNIEATLVGAVDVGIALEAAMVSAESLGLGIVPIGAVRKESEELANMLELPEYVFPMVGLCIGFPMDGSDKKPRLPKKAVFHREKYDTTDMKKLIDEYDSTMSDYMKERTNGESDRNWSQTVAQTYENVYFPKVSGSIRKKGYKSE